MQATDIIFYIVILIMSVVIHEVSHGYVAELFGDKTARFAGRLTLNPLKHLDWLGSIVFPIFLFISSRALGYPVLFGWAKPVPYNPNNLSNRKWGTVAVAAAGVLANIFIVVIFGILVHLAPYLGFPEYNAMAPHPLYVIASMIVWLNLSLSLFNLIPIPPLDGSKILFNLLPSSLSKVIRFVETYSLILIIVFIIFFSNFLYPLLTFLFKLVMGFSI